MSASEIRVVLVDEHRSYVESLAARIDAARGLRVVGTAGDAEEASRVILQTKPHVAVCDVELPGRCVFDCLDQLRKQNRTMKVLFLTGFLSNVFLERALRLKASGYLLKRETVDVVIQSIQRAAAGMTSFSKEVAVRLERGEQQNSYQLRGDCRLSRLTSRQLEVLRYLAKGDSVKEVARSLHLSHKSVDSHKYRIMQRLGIRDRVHLFRYAIREGLILP